MVKEYYTISEYAELKGVSKQAIYKRLSTSLKDYVALVDGRKVLRAEALQPIHQQKPIQSFNDFQRNNADTSRDDMIEFLKAQIEAKDRQIEKLQERAEEKDKYIREQGARLTDLIEQSNLLQQNNQILIKRLSGTVDNESIVIDDTVDIKQENQPEKKSFFSKLFG